jgi:putative SOS response-associated peptidase YedK
MCGRYAVAPSAEELAEELQAVWDRPNPAGPVFNTCPGTWMPVMTSNSNTWKLTAKRWGLIPPWESNEVPGYINARVETLHEKAAFKSYLKRQSCLIPASGYYEWLSQGKTKIPFYLHRPGEILLMAGIFNTIMLANGSEIETFAIITRPADRYIDFIHHRMPLIYSLDNADSWLHGSMERDDYIGRSIHKLEYHQVSPEVGKPENNFPSLIEPSDNPIAYQVDLF